MSYVLQIWDAAAAPRPVVLKEVVTQVAALHRQRPGMNPKFIALAQRLTKRYPDLADVLAQEDAEVECAWTDGPLDGKTESAVFNIGLNVALLEEVRPFVIEQAVASGLCVLDEQAGEARLADGAVLREPGAAVAHPLEEASDDEPPKLRELMDVVFERLKQLLGPRGYTARKQNLTFVREHGEGWHELSVYADDYWPANVMFGVGGLSRYHAVSALTASLITPEVSPENTAEQCTVGFPPSDWMEDEKLSFLGVNKMYCLLRRADVEPVLAHMEMKLQTRLLPLLERCETIEGLEELVFQKPVSHSDYGWSGGGATAIILAYLANRPDLDAICETLLKRHAKNLASYLQATQRCVDYVRSHPLKSD